MLSVRLEKKKGEKSAANDAAVDNEEISGVASSFKWPDLFTLQWLLNRKNKVAVKPDPIARDQQVLNVPLVKFQKVVKGALRTKDKLLRKKKFKSNHLTVDKTLEDNGLLVQAGCFVSFFSA